MKVNMALATKPDDFKRLRVVGMMSLWNTNSFAERTTIRSMKMPASSCVHNTDLCMSSVWVFGSPPFYGFFKCGGPSKSGTPDTGRDSSFLSALVLGASANMDFFVSFCSAICSFTVLAMRDVMFRMIRSSSELCQRFFDLAFGALFHSDNPHLSV
jgi:hypothetical protein